MKNNYKKMLLFLFVCFFTGCSVNNPVENNYGKYYGTWLWLKTEGGFFPRITTPDSGTTIKICFDNFNTFELVRNDSLKVTAHYNIEVKDSYWDKISYSSIKTFDFIFDTSAVYTQVHSDSLTIWNGASDGFFSFYKKIN